MATITLRSVKGAPLTNQEIDNNFTSLNTELGQKATLSFVNIAVTGQTTVVAESANDTLTMSGANGVNITTNPTTDTIIFTGANGFAIVSGNTGTASAEQAGDTLTIQGSGGITTSASDAGDTLIISPVIGTPSQIKVGTASAGTQDKLSKSDHVHDVLVGTPVALAAVAAEGTSLALARADHVHPFPSATQVGVLAFKTISVAGQSDVVAETAGDTLTIVAGNGVDIVTDAPNDTITISSRVTVANDTSNASKLIGFFTGNGNTKDVSSSTDLTFNPSTGVLTTKVVEVTAANDDAVLADNLPVIQSGTNKIVKTSKKNFLKNVLPRSINGSDVSLGGVTPFPFDTKAVEYTGYKTVGVGGAVGFSHAFIRNGKIAMMGWLAPFVVGANSNGGTYYGMIKDLTVTVPALVGKKCTQIARSHGGLILSVWDDGSVWVSGGINSYGAVGNGTQSTHNYDHLNILPASSSRIGKVYVTAASQYDAVDAGIIIDQFSGKMYYAGRNTEGQAGLGTLTNVLTYTEVPKVSGQNWYYAITNGTTTWAITDAASGFKVYACGFNNVGQLGDGTTSQRTTMAPVLIDGGTTQLANVKWVRYGSINSTATVAALTYDGKLYTWGGNAYGQIGDGTTTTKTKAYLAASTIEDAVVGFAQTHGIWILARRTDGSARAWGVNAWGTLGNGNTTQQNTPVIPTNGASGVLDIWVTNGTRDSGGAGSFIKKADGIYFAGRNDASISNACNLLASTIYSSYTKTNMPGDVKNIVAFGQSDASNYDYRSLMYVTEIEGETRLYYQGRTGDHQISGGTTHGITFGACASFPIHIDS